MEFASHKPNEASESTFQCPRCNSSDVTTTTENQEFGYGVGEKRVELTAHVPVRRCRNCGLEYLDHVGEEAQHDAICAHLGVLSPASIRALRVSRGMSRTDLARLTGLGEATIARWERGEIIQNTANDRLLRLTGNRVAFEALRKLADPATSAKAVSRGYNFRLLKPAQMKKAQESFQLRKKAS